MLCYTILYYALLYTMGGCFFWPPPAFLYLRYDTILYSTILYCTILCSAIQYYTMLDYKLYTIYYILHTIYYILYTIYYTLYLRCYIILYYTDNRKKKQTRRQSWPSSFICNKCMAMQYSGKVRYPSCGCFSIKIESQGIGKGPGDLKKG